MASENYKRGRRKEYSIIDKLKKEGFDIVQRSKGSHSPIDVFAIDKERKIIKLIQSKPNDYPESQVKKLHQDNKELSGQYLVEFDVM